ncbi:MAG TPA: hypothetical protein ENI85_01830 [Deltaproteobacteria bacterium]|nr:hypothetical protein [Deltaproteobacteria bacterium]
MRNAPSTRSDFPPAPPAASRLSWLALAGLAVFFFVGCQSVGSSGSLDVVESGLVPAGALHPDDLLVVDCLLPGRVRKLGRSQVYMTPRRPTKTSATECEIRGGEYTAYDRADFRTALRVWLEKAKQGDPQAQTYVGEIHEKGLGVKPDFAKAAQWYRKAADQGFERAMINLGQLYELGRGVEKDPERALAWYRKASGLEEAGLAYLTPTATGRRSGTKATGRSTRTEPTGGSEPPPKEILLARTAPPSIQLIEPSIPETRAIQIVYDPPASSRSGPSTRTLIGRVVAPAGLVGLFVDGREEKVDPQGLFRAEIEVPDHEQDVVLAAIDREGRRTERRLRVGVDPSTFERAESEARARKRRELKRGPDFGNYHALVIGNGDYRHLPRLKTAKADAEAVAETLRDRYGFHVTLIRDATRYDILSALNAMRARLTDEDNLLVYYAGHGELDKVNMRGQWLPVDAERDSTANWISNVAITDILNAMNARHVMVVSDSCYSGALTRSALANLDGALSDDKRKAWLTTLASKRSRTALTSGGLSPVLDTGGGGHSVFARAFLDVLTGNDDILEGQRLYQELSARVTYAAQNYQFEQLPQYAPIKFAGHEAGDFFLVPAN